MEQRKRPLSRKKRVSGESAHVGRRGTERGRSSQGGQGGSRGNGSFPWLKLLILAAVLLFGGGGTLTSLLGSDLLSSLGGGTADNGPDIPTGSAGQQNVKDAALNTSVSRDARKKRTALKGDGSDVATVLVYMCGTDLESNGGFATRDLQEMLAADIGEQVNLLIFTGGCKQWKNDLVSSSRNQIYQVTEDGLALQWESSALQPMTDPDTLSEYIRWGCRNYPADRYELIFWDHGGGSVSGYGYDEVYPRSGSMTLDGIAKALKDGGCAFDFVGFDACLMATLETALVVEPYADYLIASEETEPGCGWYYTDWLTALSENPSQPTIEIGKQIADDFVSVCGKAAPRQQATLSVIDLAELAGTLPEKFRAFARSTAESIRSDDYQSVAGARGRTKEFAASSNIDQVDLIHLAGNLNTAESRALASVLKAAVKYNITSGNIQNANGVSIYFPYGRTSSVNKMAETYDKIGLDKSYTECIKSFASVEVAGQAVSGGSSGQLESLFGALLSDGGGNSASSGSSADMIAQLLGSLLQGDGRSLAEVGLEGGEAGFLDEKLLENCGDYLAKNRFDPSALTWTGKDGNQVLCLTEEQWNLVQDVELNVFVDDGAGYIDLGLDNVFSFNDDGDLIGDYDRTWLAVNGQIVAYYMLSSEGTEEDYKIMGRIPALLNGQRVNLMACFTDEYPDGEILGAAVCYDEETETETIARGLLEIQEGDTIDFLCNYYDYQRNYQDSYFLGDALTVSGPLTLSNVRMDNRDYIATYRLTDIYCNHYWTPSVE